MDDIDHLNNYVINLLMLTQIKILNTLIYAENPTEPPLYLRPTQPAKQFKSHF